jgi:transposase InsO family protein
MENKIMFSFILALINLLGWVHFDVFGLVKFPWISKSLCYISFIDGYSKTWVYFLRSKFEVSSRFKVSKSLLENQTGRKIKVLRTNNGCEFCSAKFDRFYKENGINKHKITLYTLQQNGVAERMNRTLMEYA